jgi:hypothetical protein
VGGLLFILIIQKHEDILTKKLETKIFTLFPSYLKNIMAKLWDLPSEAGQILLINLIN